jgi:hypothetical protein
MSKRRLAVLLVGLALGNALLAGCALGAESALKMADLHAMPHAVQAAPAAVQDAYRFAAANPEVLQQLPCYCGCGSMGHTSNYACYLAGQDAGGALEFDSHALGCSICVDITLDAMRLLKEGKTVPEIKTYVDATYARYGPSNMP